MQTRSHFAWVSWGLLVLTAGSLISNRSAAQNVAYTLKNGLLVEGVGGTVSEISISLAVGDPNESHTIVMLDDGLKRTFFSKNDIANKGASVLSDTEIDIWQRVHDSASTGYGTLLSAEPFNENGHRTIWIRKRKKNDVGFVVEPVVQGITRINPYWTEVKTLITPDDNISKERWTMRLATSSIPANVIRNLLHRSIDSDSPSERKNILDFYLEAEQYRRAIEEHAQMEKDFPDARDNFKDDRVKLKQAYGRQVLEEIRFRESVGQINLAEQMALAIDTEEMSGTIQQDFNVFLSQTIKRENRELKSTQEELIQRVKAFIASHDNKPEQQQAAQQLADEVDSDLSRSNSARLASYRRLLSDTTQSDEQLMALAISGWLLGSNNAIDNLAVAQSLFTVRGLVREYLSTATEARRTQILTELAKYEGSEPEFLAPMINNMTPPRAPDLTKYTGEHPLEFEVTIKGTKAQKGQIQKFRYLVHLPPEYDPYRKYPCLLTLRSVNSVEAQLDRWAGLYSPGLGIRTGRAMRHGYIVVSLDWKSKEQGAYEYSAREHKVILKCMRDTLKKFSIDTDRYFLTGHGVGADAAYDVAVSHPEHWAGVIGISGKIAKYPVQYNRNVHLGLNVYSVVGTKDHGNIEPSTKAWNTWLGGSRFNRCLVVEYIGRVAEPFYEEFPSILAWCDVNRRAWPNAAEKTEIKCDVIRPWDNYFWFIQFHGVPEKNVMRPTNWPASGSGFNPVVVGATLQGNAFKRVSPGKIGRGMTFWLSPDYIDFSKKVQVMSRGGGFKDYVKPSRETMLEDVRTRADRKRPYWAKIDVR